MTKIMIVEDDVALRDIYSSRMEAEGYEVVTASDGEEALTVAVKERPDLIVLDIMMPKISGFDTLDILRATPETKETKIIMMSALSQTADIEKGKALGADEYLVKSQVTLSEVISKVKEILEKPRQKA
ncbi:MAG: response regulator [Patescibacteria group bacterium]|nr:response regulator [Patescibacteria group bacterium]